MRRIYALAALCAALAAGLGCQHIGGKCDCGYNPADYPITGPTDPHPSAPVLKPTPAPAAMPAPKSANE
jgi:hypothetical protein